MFFHFASIPTLSFCITCKNRFHQISQTLRQNIEDNKMFKHLIEFVLVDFGSTDGLFKWVDENFRKEIETGYLKYYYTDCLPFWHASIAKNTSHLLASNQILVNLDCDNYTGLNGGKYVIQQFMKYGMDIVLHQTFRSDGGAFGRISSTKTNFLRINGYDEDLHPMAYQDVDYIRRLKELGVRYLPDCKSEYSQFIPNSKIEGISQCYTQISWEQMEILNLSESGENIKQGRLIANVDRKIGVSFSFDFSTAKEILS